MDSHSGNGIYDFDTKSIGNSQSEEISVGENGMIRLDIDLAYFSEKLVNLDLYMTMLSLEESGLGELSKQSDVSEVEIEKAMILDLLFGYLDSEVTELGHLLNAKRTEIVETHQQIYSRGQKRDICNTLHEKLHEVESSWKHLQQKLSEMKQQLNNTIYLLEDESLERSDYELQKARQQKLILRMLEKSVAAELDLEKQLLASKQREEELKSRLELTNEVVTDMEAFAEAALQRLLEVEHSADVYMGITKETASRLQIFQFNLHCSVQREEELKSKLQRCRDREEKVKILEEKLQEANDSYEVSQEQLSVMGNTVESLKERVFVAESMAHNTEMKLTALTEENMELREEVGFLKGGDGNEEKISLLEKQSRELETQLQTARTASEASLEQQNMLYTAIWDMETLIEELKSKVSKAESRADNAEEQCLVLAETGVELNKEISFLKSRSEKLEESLKEANRGKAARVKETNTGAKLITDMVMQLAIERERIQKQLSSLARENKILLEELRKMRNGAKAKQDNQEDDGNELSSNEDNLPNSISRGASTVKEIGETPASATASNQVDKPSEQNLTDDAEAAGSSTCDDAAADVDFPNNENRGKGRSGHHYEKCYMFAAVLVLALSVLAVSINWQDISFIVRQQFLGLL